MDCIFGAKHIPLGYLPIPGKIHYSKSSSLVTWERQSMMVQLSSTVISQAPLIQQTRLSRTWIMNIFLNGISSHQKWSPWHQRSLNTTDQIIKDLDNEYISQCDQFTSEVEPLHQRSHI